jgi:hypothetical protein
MTYMKRRQIILSNRDESSFAGNIDCFIEGIGEENLSGYGDKYAYHNARIRQIRIERPFTKFAE